MSSSHETFVKEKRWFWGGGRRKISPNQHQTPPLPTLFICLFTQNNPPPLLFSAWLQCSHDTAEDNLVVKIVKFAQNEWGVTPTPTTVTKLATALNNVLSGQGLRGDGGAAVAGAAMEADGPGGVSRKAGGELLAPGHGGLGCSGVGKGVKENIEMLQSMAYELD